MTNKLKKSVLFFSALLFVGCASQVLLARGPASTKTKKKPKGISWIYKYDEDKRTLSFSRVKSSKNKVVNIGIYNPEDHSIMGEEDEATPKIATFKNKKFFLVTYWNMGQAGLIRVFNPEEKTEPLCEFGTESDSVQYKIENGKLMVEVADGKFIWKECLKLK